MARGGLNVRPVFSSPIFLGTFIMAFAGWFTAFIGQIVLEANYHSAGGKGSAVGVLWFAIFLQLFVTLGVFYTLATDSVGQNRIQLSVFLAILVVFAVLGVNSGIFQATSSQLALGAGWLLLSFVDIIWLLFFTSEEESFILSLFDSLSGGASFSRNANGSLARRNHRASGLGISNTSGPVSYQTYSGVGNGNKLASSNSLGGIGGASAADLSGGPEDSSRSPMMGGQTSELEGQQQQQTQEYNLKARALYSYTASPDDPNEISFAKGEMLDIVDNSGKWWQARKADGSKGIIPSNYVTLA